MYSGIAVECGAGVTTSVPVFEGLALSHAAMCVDYGGQDISANLKRLLGINIKYQYIFLSHYLLFTSICNSNII